MAGGYASEDVTLGRVTGDLDVLAARLDDIVAELDDLAFTALRAAASDGAGRRPEIDKRLTQARRAVEKAAHLLRGAADDTDA